MVRKSHVVYYPAPFLQLSLLLCFFAFPQHGPFLGSCIRLLTNILGIYRNNKLFHNFKLHLLQTSGEDSQSFTSWL